MKTSDLKKLELLLIQLKEENLQSPNLPYDIWMAIGQLTAYPIVDMIITTTGKNFLLTYRKDEYWDAWHIPGGFIGVGETVNKVCDRIANKELGISVDVKKIQDVYVWEKPKRVNGITLICQCEPIGEPKEGTYFTEIPTPTIEEHVGFLEKFLSVSK